MRTERPLLASWRARTHPMFPQWLVYDCSGNGDAGESRGARRSRGARAPADGGARGEAHPLVSERAARAAAGHGSRSSHCRAARAHARASARRCASRSRSTCSRRKGCRTFIGCSPSTSAATASGRKWTNLWTAEEDRHGAVLHDYTRDSQLLNNPVLERMQFEYLKAGFEPAWDKDPYRVFVYTTLQERATQVSHANTGKLAGEYEPTIGVVLSNVAKEEARHYVFYRHDLRGSARARSEPRARVGRRDHAVDRHAGREHAELPRDGRRHPARGNLRPARLSEDRRGADQALGDRGDRGPRRNGHDRRRRRSWRSRSASSALPTRWKRAARRRPSRSSVAFAREFAMD